MKKEEKKELTLQEQIDALNKSRASLQGQNTKLKRHNEIIAANLTKTATELAQVKKELAEAKAEVNDYEALVEWYNTQPWYKKMFMWQI